MNFSRFQDRSRHGRWSRVRVGDYVLVQRNRRPVACGRVTSVSYERIRLNDSGDEPFWGQWRKWDWGYCAEPGYISWRKASLEQVRRYVRRMMSAGEEG